MKKAFPALLALLCACLALLVATSSSPLYATNFWTDTNIYFTIGRGMTRGLMPYRDLFDHKGPLLFILYALGAAISDTSFIGVFALEALSLAAAVYAGWRTVRLFGEGRLTLLAMPLLAAATCCCTAFTQGGSAEEFALPALAVGVYLTLAAMTRPEGKTRGRMLGFGAAAGWVFLIKYTDIGLFAGLGVCLLAFVWRREGFGRALLAAGGCCWARAGLRAGGGVSGGQRCAGRVRRGLFRAEPV
ncbi:MAG: glycosyltransferase family 39 protein [Christensenellales bacterium]